MVGLVGGGWLGFGCGSGCGGFAVAVGLEWDRERAGLGGCWNEHKTSEFRGTENLSTGSTETGRSFR